MSDLFLAVDFGTTATCVAVGRAEGPITLTEYALVRSTRMPSCVYLTSDGRVLAGGKAERQSVVDASRFESTPKRQLANGEELLHLAEDVPVVEAVAAVLREAIAPLGRIEGAPVSLTHPAAWLDGPQLEVLAAAAERAGLGQVRLVAEPEAAAWDVVPEDARREGALYAMFDWGGGTFDAAVVRWTGDDFEVAGPTTGVDPLGGEDIDSLVVAHVLAHVPDDLRRALEQPSDAEEREERRSLWEQARSAKEELCTEPRSSVFLRHGEVSVDMTRQELERAVVPLVAQALDAFASCLASARVEPPQLAGIYLVGGTSRIPSVHQSVWERFELEPTLPMDAKRPVAAGAVARLRAMAAVPVETPAPRGGGEPARTRSSKSRRRARPRAESTARAGALLPPRMEILAADAARAALAAGAGSPDGHRFSVRECEMTATAETSVVLLRDTPQAPSASDLERVRSDPLGSMAAILGDVRVLEAGPIDAFRSNGRPPPAVYRARFTGEGNPMTEYALAVLDARTVMLWVNVADDGARRQIFERTLDQELRSTAVESSCALSAGIWVPQGWTVRERLCAVLGVGGKTAGIVWAMSRSTSADEDMDAAALRWWRAFASYYELEFEHPTAAYRSDYVNQAGRAGEVAAATANENATGPSAHELWRWRGKPRVHETTHVELWGTSAVAVLGTVARTPVLTAHALVGGLTASASVWLDPSVLGPTVDAKGLCHELLGLVRCEDRA